MNNIEQVLKTYYGYDEFRPLQKEIIMHTIGGGDSLVLMPTGGGKSLCFQMAALVMDGMAVIVSPLISLMKDQVEGLRMNGIAAEALNSSNDEGYNRDIINRCVEGKVKMLYISPERLVSGVLAILQNVQVSLFAIDEAHCISGWGHDFRPEYTQLGQLKQLFPHVPIMALTATADKITKEDILVQLNIISAKTYISSFDRPNLSLDVKRGYSAKDKLRFIEELIRRHPGESGIIYCLARKTTEALAVKLKMDGFSVGVYHAGMPTSERNQVQDDFQNDRVQVICATIAFGMGIDKSNVRFVVHYNLPKSIESFYQEIGRGGRDGLPCETILFYNLQDIITLRKFADESGQREINFDKLKRMQEYAEAQVCRRRILLNYFGEISGKDCGNCDVCHTPPQLFDGTTIVQKALSAIVRTEEKIGFTLMVDILRGTLSPDVVSNKYNEIKTFGTGRDISARDWHDYLLQMLQMGFFEIAYNEDRHLHITPLGKEVLYGRSKVQLAIINRVEFTVKSRRKKQREEREMEWAAVRQGQSGDLFNRLREVRRQVAAEIGKPAFIVMSDKSLQDLVLKRPTTLEAMADVYGFGEYKAKAYGKPFIEAIRQYANDSADLPFPNAVALVDVSLTQIPSKPTSYMEQQKQLHANAYTHWNDEEDKKLTEYYRQGLSTSEIASLMNRNAGGISSRIKKLGLRDSDKTLSTTADLTAKKEDTDEYKQELDRLIEMQADIKRQIEELRKKMGQ
jgi:ATP-dependent DNA helicase RecQ